MSTTIDNSVSVKAAAPYSNTVLFVHGAWMNPASWDKFRGAFEAAGYRTIAPTWPHLDKPASELRAGANEELIGKTTLKDIVDHYEAIISGLDEQPILVGHSFGGLIIQLLLDRGLGVAGIALDPGPIAGALIGPVSLAAAFPVLARLDGWNKPYLLTREGFARNFANTVPADEQARAYDDYVVPTSGRIFYQAASMIGTAVNTKSRKQPLLVVVGEKDRTVTPFVARNVYKAQKKSAARTDFKEFAGRSHFIANEKGWEEVAEYAIGWADQVVSR